jgi:Tfp pilus assembly protein PilN
VTPLNLARQPFRNERVPTALLSLAVLLLAAITVRHAVVAWGLLPGKAGDLETGVLALEAEASRLGAEAAGLRGVEATTDSIKEWLAVKTLVDRRAFSWTGLFAALEESLPPGVKLVSVTPQEGAAGTELSLVAVGRDEADALALLQSLQSREDFEEAFLSGWNEGREGIDIACTVRYSPGRARAPEGRR